MLPSHVLTHYYMEPQISIEAQGPGPRAAASAAERRRRKRRLLGRILFVLLALVLLDYALYPHLPAPQAASGNRGENGLWLRYPWYFGRHSDQEAVALARRLEAQEIRYAYFHVRHITRDGSLRYRYPAEARRLLAVLRREAPEVKPVAWIFAGNVHRAPGLAEVDLANPEVRRRMVREARWLVEKCGFEGVQWDYEICPSGDPHFLALLRETRAALPRRAASGAPPLLGAATALWLPHPLRHWGWSEGYMAQVAGECDQIAVMGYDSGMYLPRAYARLIGLQVVHATRAATAAGGRCRVLLGVPTYTRGGASHHAHAENLRVALKAVRSGLAARDARPEAFAGVALFADYTTQPEEWRTYEDLWLQRWLRRDARASARPR